MGMWQVGVVPKTDTSTHREKHQASHTRSAFSLLFLVNSLWAISPIPFILSYHSHTVFFFKHEQDAGGSEVKTRFMFELKPYFSVKQKLAVS